MAIITISADTLLSDVVYAANDTLTITNNAILTCDATPSLMPSTTQCITNGKFRIVNASTTTPIVFTLFNNSANFAFEQNGIFEVRGAPISLGSATGLASETFDFSSAPLNTIPYPSHVEIETASGSGNYYAYFVVCTAGKPVTWATTEFCATGASGRVLFWDATNRILTSGNGTNGSLLPTGANVRIPNIYIDSNVQNATPASRSEFDLNPAGTLDFEWCALSDRIYCSVSIFTKIRMSHVGWCGTVNMITSNATVEIDHMSIQPDTEQTTVAQTHNITGINGAVSIVKVTSLMAGLISQANSHQVSTLFGLTVWDDCTYARRDGRSVATNDALLVNNIAPITVNNLSVSGAQFEPTNLSDVTFKNFRHADSLGTVQLTTIAENAINGVNCSRLKFIGIGNAGVASCRSALFLFNSQSKDNEIYDVNYDAGSNCANLTSGSDANLKVINSTISNLRGDLPFLDSPSNFLNANYILRNVRASRGTGTFTSNDGAQGAEINFFAGNPDNFLLPIPAIINYNFANLVEPVLSPTTGALVAGPFAPSTGATITGSAFYNQNGRIYLNQINDSIELETRFSCVGITSFQNADPVWTYTETSTQVTNTTTAPAGINAEFRIRTKTGTYGAYQALAGANLSGAISALTGYDSDQGLYFQLKMTATILDTTRFIDKVYFATNVDSTYTAPDGELTLLGPNVDDVTTMYLDSDDSVIATFTGAGTHEFSGASTNLGEDIYYIRRTAGSIVIYSTQSAPVPMVIGNQGDVKLFAGEEVQLAQSSDVASIKSVIDSYLDVAISTRLATTGYTVPPTAVQIRTEIDSNSTKLIDIVADTNELQTNQGQWVTATGFAIAGDEMNLVNNAITSNKIANNALNNSAFTTGYFNAINSEVDTALTDYDAPTKAEMDSAFTEIKGAGWTDETLKDIRDSALTLGNIEGSTILAKEATLVTIDSVVDAILVDTNDLQTNQGDWVTADDTNVINAINALNDFDPATDVVARVTLVDTTTTNSDMRGTDSAITSLAGIATSANVTASQLAIIAEIDELETKAQADARQAILVAEHDATQSTLASLNNLSLAQIEASTVLAKEATINAQTASIKGADDRDLSELRDNQNVINQGLKKSSLFVPHGTNLT